MSRNTIQRDYELCEIFDNIVKYNLGRGKSFLESKEAAFDAIEVRFGVSKSRSRNILSQMRKLKSSETKECHIRFKTNIKELQDLLKLLNTCIK